MNQHVFESVEFKLHSLGYEHQVKRTSTTTKTELKRDISSFIKLFRSKQMSSNGNLSTHVRMQESEKKAESSTIYY